MYRYNAHVKEQSNVNPRFMRRLKILLALLLVAVIALSVIVIHFARLDGTYRSLTLARMQSEMGQAVSQVNALSRTGASSTYSQLARIRQRVYATQLLNDQRVSLYGSSSQLADAAVFTQLYALLDDFESRLNTGSTTNEVQNNLISQVTALNELMQNAK